MSDPRTEAKAPGTGEYIALASISVAAAALRFAQLGAESLWSDELATVHHIQFSPLSARFWVELRSDVHPPAYYILLRLWSAVFGDDEAALRALSALAGVAFCVVLWAFARRYLGAAVAICAALLAAVSPLLVQYSHEARAYALLCLSVTWVAWAWLDLLEPGSSARASRLRVAIAGAAAASAAYIHYSGLIVTGVIVLLVGAFAALRMRAALRSLLLAAVVAAILYAPWAPSLLDDLARGGLTFLKQPRVADVIRYPLYVLPAISWTVIGLFAVAIGLVPREEPPAQPGLTPLAPSPDGSTPQALRFVAFLAAWTALTLFAFFLKSRLSTPIFNVRNLIVVAPPILVLAGWAVVACARGWRTAWITCTLLVAAASTHHLLFQTTLYGHRSQEQFREATQCAIGFAQRHPRAAVVALTYDDYFDYYLRHLQSDLKVQTSTSRSARLADAVAGAWTAGAPQVIVIWAHIPLKKTDRSRILKDRILVEEFELKKAGCMLIARDAEP